MTAEVAQCAARAYDCHCGLPGGHLPFQVHACGVPGCMASWTGDPETDTFRPVTLPTWPLIPPTTRPALRLVAS
jgi:hypothetical protein